MLSIDRVKVNALTLFGLTARPHPDDERSIPDDADAADDLPSPAVPLVPRTPLFDAVEAALRDAGYLDASRHRATPS